jgi:ATP-dependent protease ClpP protease subunit
MKHRTLSQLIIVICAVMLLAATALAGQAVELKLKDGSKWRGTVGDSVEVRFMQQNIEVTLQGKLAKAENLYIQLDTEFGGKSVSKVIFNADIVSVKSTAAAGPSEEKPASPASKTPTPSASPSSPNAADQSDKKPLGVFVLPLEGTVGETFRHEEIDKMAEYMDKNYGPGQVLVLLINSNGGSALESQIIANSIREIKKRHRVIAWIHKAISAGCQTAMCCPEIYFMTEGTAGAVTTWNPGTGQSIKGEDLERAMEHLAQIAIENGYSKYIAYSMKTNKAMCSYDRDPVTGDITWYGDLSGKYVLSDDKSNLSFNASNALHCKFSKGTADTEEDLAKLLNLPKWYEFSDYGRKLAKEWQALCEQAHNEIPLLLQRMSYKNTSTGDAVVILGTRIGILTDLIRWLDRCPNVAEQMLGPKEISKPRLQREIDELRLQVANLKKRR